MKAAIRNPLLGSDQGNRKPASTVFYSGFEEPESVHSILVNLKVTFNHLLQFLTCRKCSHQISWYYILLTGLAGFLLHCHCIVLKMFQLLETLHVPGTQ